jgi:hypothetical protein
LGLLRASAMNSRRSFTFSVGETTSTCGIVASVVTGAKSATGS